MKLKNCTVIAARMAALLALASTNACTNDSPVTDSNGATISGQASDAITIDVDAASPPPTAPTREDISDLAVDVYSDSTVELFWPRTSQHSADVNHIVYQNGVQIAESNGYSQLVDGLQAGTLYAFEVRRIAPDGSVESIYRQQARTQGTSTNIGLLNVNGQSIYESLAPSAISALESDFERVRVWLTTTQDVPGLQLIGPPPANPDGSVDFIGTYNCPLAGSVAVEQHINLYNFIHVYTFDQCQFPQHSSTPPGIATDSLNRFSVLDGRLKRNLFLFGDSAGSARSFLLESDAFNATRHDGSVVSMQGSAELGNTNTVLKASSLPNGDAVLTFDATYNLDSFSDSAIASGTQFEAIRSSLSAKEVLTGIEYSIEQSSPVRITNTTGSTTLTLLEPIRFHVGNDTASANILLTSDNGSSVSYHSNGNLRTPSNVSTSTADGPITNNDVPFNNAEHLPRDLMSQFCDARNCNFINRLVTSSGE